MQLINSLLIVALVLGGSLGAAKAAETIKIGLLTPLTGFAAADGLSVKNSVDLAVEKVNKEGGLLGKKVELVTYDDRADAKDAVASRHPAGLVVSLVAGSPFPGQVALCRDGHPWRPVVTPVSPRPASTRRVPQAVEDRGPLPWSFK
jgi:hypothetical protein